jgi:hypothetical protein
MLGAQPSQLNNGGLCLGLAGKVPLCNCSFASGAARLKHIDRHNEREAIQSDVHVVVDNLIIGHPAQETRQLTHTLTLPESAGRETINGAEKSFVVNPKLTKVSGLTLNSNAGVAPPSPATGASVQPARSRPILSIAA